MKQVANNTERYLGFDVLKCLCCLMVVNVHYGVPEGIFWTYVQNISRIGVPCFLMITGFFLLDMLKQEGRISRYLIKIAILTIIAFIANLSWDFVIAFRDGSTNELLAIFTSPKTYKNLLLWGYTDKAGHLWYMYALFFDILIIAGLYKSVRHIRVASIIIDRLMVAYIVCMWVICLYLNSIGTPYYVCRSYLIFSMPFILVGHLLRKYHSELQSTLTGWALPIMLVMVLVEQLMNKHDVLHDFSVSTTLISMTFVLLSLNLSQGVFSRLGGGNIHRAKPIVIYLPLSYFCWWYRTAFY